MVPESWPAKQEECIRGRKIAGAPPPGAEERPGQVGGTCHPEVVDRLVSQAATKKKRLPTGGLGSLRSQTALPPQEV